MSTPTSPSETPGASRAPVRIASGLAHGDLGRRFRRAASVGIACDNGNHVATMAGDRLEGAHRILDSIPEHGRVYISVDILVLLLVPGCASAEADGLTYNELRQSIFAIAANHERAGFDVVEINLHARRALAQHLAPGHSAHHRVAWPRSAQ